MSSPIGSARGQRGARAPVAPVVDPADAGHERVGGVLDLPLAGFAHELPHRLDQIVRRAGRLAGRDLAAAGVHRQRAVVGQVGVADERHALARLAEAERLELDHQRDQEVVVGMERAHVLDVQPAAASAFLPAISWPLRVTSTRFSPPRKLVRSA